MTGDASHMYTTATGMAQRLRIAIGLAALRYKPADQSYDSYILDLRRRFFHHSPLSPGQAIWREKALKLEHQVRELQSRHDADIAEISTLKAKLSFSSTSSSTPDCSQLSTTNKKKQKKRALGPSQAPPVEQGFAMDKALVGLQSCLEYIRREWKVKRSFEDGLTLFSRSPFQLNDLRVVVILLPFDGMSGISSIASRRRICFAVWIYASVMRLSRNSYPRISVLLITPI
ncbi:hypothetical protein PUNSTDRAFT_128917 [Punctularia strigosozonata HHB-11173 SS5]|uniref:uncharacterized protein n=1 Tax=Punctularia strigosozonata (strain HHB-11173) TaxID=741275 RepID=UPI0004416EB4|nr:uncharacterized protein PUNSTDRAFT_128917 [Punctularia strigosozonata HHB-11173 SS5]EIN13230.1 hypothetical protein PUNSTDRAFT_128917 [Punctularia strigosozonata HHB-11173 SS5]